MAALGGRVLIVSITLEEWKLIGGHDQHLRKPNLKQLKQTECVHEVGLQTGCVYEVELVENSENNFLIGYHNTIPQT